jgi:hypothetical protein
VALVALVASMAAGAPARAVGYRVRLDTRFDSVAFRGVAIDSIPIGEVVTGPDGGLYTPNGFAVRCAPGSDWCTYYRPTAIRRGAPVAGTIDATVWGLGVPGLSVRATARHASDFRSEESWPGTDPGFRLLEATAEYTIPWLTARAGRTHEASRLGFVGYDGARLETRALDRRLRAAAWGGWGLARGVALPATHTALDPLDDFLPRERQRLVGTSLGWASRAVTGRAIWQREVDPHADDLVSERAGVDAAVRGPYLVRFTGGADYDLAAGWWGSAEAALSRPLPRWPGSVTVGVRRYRPHFDLWTIWGAFAPTPYRAVHGEVRVSPWPTLEVRGRGERYSFEDTETTTPLVTAEDDGWRWSLTGAWRRGPTWEVRGGLHEEHGPGASSLGYDAGLTVEVTRKITAGLTGSYLERPLEFRYSDARVWTWGLEADWRASSRFRLGGRVLRLDESRDRPDAAAFDWDQIRVGIHATLLLDSGPDRATVPPAVLRIPERGGAR